MHVGWTITSLIYGGVLNVESYAGINPRPPSLFLPLPSLRITFTLTCLRHPKKTHLIPPAQRLKVSPTSPPPILRHPPRRRCASSSAIQPSHRRSGHPSPKCNFTSRYARRCSIILPHSIYIHTLYCRILLVADSIDRSLSPLSSSIRECRLYIEVRAPPQHCPFHLISTLPCPSRRLLCASLLTPPSLKTPSALLQVLSTTGRHMCTSTSGNWKEGDGGVSTRQSHERVRGVPPLLSPPCSLYHLRLHLLLRRTSTPLIMSVMLIYRYAQYALYTPRSLPASATSYRHRPSSMLCRPSVHVVRPPRLTLPHSVPPSHARYVHRCSIILL